jgi:hypothetical protein
MLRGAKERAAELEQANQANDVSAIVPFSPVPAEILHGGFSHCKSIQFGSGWL